MKKKLRKLGKIVLITILVFAFAVPALATNLQEEEQKKEELEEQLQDAQATLKELENLKSDTNAYLKELDKSLDSINSYIQQLKTQAKEKQQQIDANVALIAQKEQEIAEQYEAMQMRIKFMYENAEIGYIDMLLGSENLSEMLNKAEYMSKITQYDRDMLTKIQETKAEIEKTKAQLEIEKADIINLQQAQEAKQNDIEVLVNEKSAQIKAVETQIKSAKDFNASLQAEIADQEAVIARIKASVDQGSNGYTGGTLLWPVPGYYKVSSDYANRIHPIFGYQELHDGIDIPAPTGTPVIAAHSGTVIISKLSSSAGNYIVIYHGNNLYTEYMHLNSRNVKVGDTVSAGQTIGTVGSTGWSTGAHLHFSVNTSSGAFKTSNRVNPNPYLNR